MERTMKHLNRSKTNHYVSLGAVTVGVALLVAACGGGGGGTGSSAVGTLNGVVIDGPIEGARVYLDLNGNLERDENEPISGFTNAEGQFSLNTSGLSPAQLASAMLVTDIPSTAKDRDDGGQTIEQAGKQPFTMLAPASAFIEATDGSPRVVSDAVVSPLTTLVAGEMINTGLPLVEARENVKQAKQLAVDPLSDFIAADHTETANIARAAAVALGEAKKQAENELGDATAQDVIQAAIQTVQTKLPEVLNDLQVKTNNNVPVNALQNKLKDLGVNSASSTPPDTPNLDASSVATPQFNDYIVVFKDSVGNPLQQASNAASAHGGNVRFNYSRAIKGFAVRLPEAASAGFLNAMSSNPVVDYVETDAVVKTRQSTTQNSATWGLDRIDQRDLPLNGSYGYNTNGAGVRAYVVDTGILASHTQFGGRVTTGYTAIADGNGTNDCNGHGTHVAGTVGSSTYGVAKSVQLVPVRVLGCAGEGTLSGVIAGIDWVLADPARTGPSVINMSLGGGASTSLDSAVAKAVASGVPVVVAAGNDNANACNYSPAREPAAITVGATASNDARSTFSNFGSCLDVFAPGTSITSTWYTSTTAISTINGTSMAAPHVAGLAALYLSVLPSATPAEVNNWIVSTATIGKVTNAGTGSPNRLLFTLGSSTTVQPAPTTVVSVAGLTGSASTLKNGWQATVTISVKNTSGQAVGGANVTGKFTVGGSSVSCTTGSNGLCSVKTGNLGRTTTQTSYSVTNITGTGLSYDASRNSVSSIIVRRP
jgi:aqualysin 1